MRATQPSAGLLCVLSLVFSSVAGSEGLLQGDLPRSALQPFGIRRASSDGPLVTVERLAAGSPAAQAGLKDGDIILRIDGGQYTSPAAARRILEHGRGGQSVTLEVRRGDSRHNVRYVAPPAPLESIAGVTSVYDSLPVENEMRLRTIMTRPHGASGRLPAIYFVQWLSCDSIEYPLNPQDHGWQTMLQLLASTSGVVMMRTEKAGIGDSQGDCADLDYETELAHHRMALQRLKASEFVDANRIVLYGASMGGNLATLLAAETQPAGLVIWGTAIKSWFEHLIEFNRRNLELAGRAPAEIEPAINRQIRFLTEFLIRGRSPAQIAAADTDLGAVWNEIRGSSGSTLYGRPYRFHQQAQARNWLGAVGALRMPTLVLYGEYDWFEEEDDHALIARMVNRARLGSARYVVVPKTDHHFYVYPSLQAAYDRKDGLVAPQRPVSEIASWVRALPHRNELGW